MFLSAADYAGARAEAEGVKEAPGVAKKLAVDLDAIQEEVARTYFQRASDTLKESVKKGRKGKWELAANLYAAAIDALPDEESLLAAYAHFGRARVLDEKFREEARFGMGSEAEMDQCSSSYKRCTEIEPSFVLGWTRRIEFFDVTQQVDAASAAIEVCNEFLKLVQSDQLVVDGSTAERAKVERARLWVEWKLEKLAEAGGGRKGAFGFLEKLVGGGKDDKKGGKKDKRLGLEEDADEEDAVGAQEGALEEVLALTKKFPAPPEISFKGGSRKNETGYTAKHATAIVENWVEVVAESYFEEREAKDRKEEHRISVAHQKHMLVKDVIMFVEKEIKTTFSAQQEKAANSKKEKEKLVKEIQSIRSVFELVEKKQEERRAAEKKEEEDRRVMREKQAKRDKLREEKEAKGRGGEEEGGRKEKGKGKKGKGGKGAGGAEGAGGTGEEDEAEDKWKARERARKKVPFLVMMVVGMVLLIAVVCLMVGMVSSGFSDVGDGAGGEKGNATTASKMPNLEGGGMDDPELLAKLMEEEEERRRMEEEMEDRDIMELDEEDEL